MAPIAISPERAVPQLDSLTTAFDDTIRFYLNGTRVVLDEIDPEVTLLEYLRGIGLTGTKLYVDSVRHVTMHPDVQTSHGHTCHPLTTSY